GVTLFIIRQELSNLCSYGLRVGEGDKNPAAIRQKFGCVPIRRRDHGLAEAEAVGQRARGHLRRVQVGGNIGVAHRDESEQRCLVNELVQEYDVVVYAELASARDKTFAIGLPLLADEVGMRRAEDDVNGVWSAAKDRWHRVD